MTQDDPPAEKKMREAVAGDNCSVKSLAELKNLENFVFKEVLGNAPEKKVNLNS